MSTPNEGNPTAPDRIDTADAAAVAQWAKRLNVTAQQIKDAVAKVGPLASDVEMHLNGTRATTNDDKIERNT